MNIKYFDVFLRKYLTFVENKDGSEKLEQIGADCK